MTVEEKQLVRAAAMYRNRSLQLQLQHFTDRSLHYSCSHVQKQVFALQLQPCTETGLCITAAAMYRNRSLHYSCSHVQKQVFTITAAAMYRQVFILQLQPCKETALYTYSCHHIKKQLFTTAAAAMYRNSSVQVQPCNCVEMQLHIQRFCRGEKAV